MELIIKKLYYIIIKKCKDAIIKKLRAATYSLFAEKYIANFVFGLTIVNPTHGNKSVSLHQESSHQNKEKTKREYT